MGGGASEQVDGIIQSVAEADPVIPSPSNTQFLLLPLSLFRLLGFFLLLVVELFLMLLMLFKLPWFCLLFHLLLLVELLKQIQFFWLHQFLLLLVVEFFQVFPGVLLFKLPWFSLHILPLSLFLCMQMEMPLLCLGITLFKFLILICVTPPEMRRWYSSQLYQELKLSQEQREQNLHQ